MLRITSACSHPLRRIAGAIAGALLGALIAVPAASAQPTPFVDIHSAGPLGDIYIGNDLGCQVRAGGFSSTEFFPNASGPGDCGTFLSVENDPSELYGPDFANHGSTGTDFTSDSIYTAFTPVSQTGVTGSGTGANPYQVTTTVAAGTSGLTVTEVDSYVVGNDYFQTGITVTNNSDVTQTALVYHAADCLLRGSTSGFGAVETSTPNGPAPGCSATPNNSPASASEQFMPITLGDSYVEERSGNTTGAREIWGDIASQAPLSNSCDCTTDEDNAAAIEWRALRQATGSKSTFSMRTVIVDTVPAGGFAFSAGAGATVGGTVATLTDPNTSAAPSAYAATINWGDGTTSAGTVAGGSGNFAVTGNHSYAAAGTYAVAVTITSLATSQGSSTVTDSATITATPGLGATGPPGSLSTGAPSVTATGAEFTGAVNPNGLPTSARFQYGPDPKYSGGGPLVYTHSTPAQAAGSDFTTHVVSASVSGLVPNALYHLRLVATNAAGTTSGPDVTFTTGKLPPPGPPVLGKAFNVSLVSGVVLVKVHGAFIPLTELTQVPRNTVIDALHGTVALITAAPAPAGARDAAANAKKHRTRTQQGTFGGAIFEISQATAGAGRGLATLALVEGAFRGAPSYATCTRHRAEDPIARAASRRTLQLLRASAHGKFRTKGRYSSATVLGTKWTVADRCDGTLTHDITDSVAVNDFVRHKTIVLHAGQSYLARAPGVHG